MGETVGARGATGTLVRLSHRIYAAFSFLFLLAVPTRRHVSAESDRHVSSRPLEQPTT